jgi:hypothetical protein
VQYISAKTSLTVGQDMERRAKKSSLELSTNEMNDIDIEELFKMKDIHEPYPGLFTACWRIRKTVFAYEETF